MLKHGGLVVGIDSESVRLYADQLESLHWDEDGGRGLLLLFNWFKLCGLPTSKKPELGEQLHARITGMRHILTQKQIDYRLNLHTTLGNTPFIPRSAMTTESTSALSENRPSSGLALSSMILGIISTLGGVILLIPPILAVVFGHRALSDCKKNPALSGRSMAITGLVTGYVGLLIIAVFGGAAGIGYYMAPQNSTGAAAAEVRGIEQTQSANLGNSDQSGSDNRPENIAGVLVGIASFILFLSFIIAIPGLIMGLNNTLVIYNGQQDVVLSFLVLLSLVAGLMLVNTSALASVGALLLTALCVYLSFRDSMIVNQTFARALIAVPTKIILVCLFIFTGLIAIGGIIEGIDDLKKGNRKKAVKNLATGIAAGLSAYLIKNLINKLVKDRATQLT